MKRNRNAVPFFWNVYIQKSKLNNLACFFV